MKVYEELVKKEQKYGINIYKFLEYVLDKALRNGIEKNSEWTGRDLIEVLSEYFKINR